MGESYCGYKQISDAVDSKLKLQKCNDDGMNPAGPCLKQLNNKKHFIIHTPEHDKSLHLVIAHDVKQEVVLTGNNEIDKQVGYAMLLMNTGKLDQAIDQFTDIIKEHPWVTAAYFGRGTAYVQKGLQHKENAEAAIQDFSSIIRLSPDNPDGWIKRAEVFSPLGKIKEALADIKVALDLRPSAQLFVMSGTLLFMQEDYEAASESFMKCLAIEKNQPTAMLYHGLSLYHRGRVKESIEIFKQVLQTNTNQAECHRSLGHAYRELGSPDFAHLHFTAAVMMEPTVAQNYHSRGILNYMRGKPAEAITDLKACLKYNPKSISCKYWKGVSYAAIGNFYEAVKSSAKILLSNSSPMQNVDVIKSHYLKEYSRYLHSHLDTPLSEYSPDTDLDGRLKDLWVKGLPFNAKNYSEQPGIQPHIREVEEVSFDYLSPDAQFLLCKSSTLGPLVQYHADGFLPNVRHHRAMGLAILDVAQVAHKNWKAGRSSKTNLKKIASWRDMFDVAVKWRRISDPEQPVFWLDLMPEKSVKTGFNFRMNLLRGQLKSVRYSDYFEKIFQFTKTMLQHLYRVNEFNTKEFKRQVEKAKTCRELIQVLKQHDTSNQQPGMILSTHVSSSKTGGGTKSLEGLNLSLSESGSNILFTMDTPTTPSRTAGYHSELDHIWRHLNDEMRRPGNKDVDVVGNDILSLVYYFFNLMPLSRGSSAVAYTVALGLFLAVGRETTGKIPPGKEVDLEAMIGGSVENFTKNVKGWLGLRKLSKPVSSLPLVSEVFPTLRTVLEALNVRFTEADCKDLKSV
ncbi:tetratricopeptide repeat protein 13-like isoform X2 [Orbicella faveolata]|uniref:tetratricopeptide repeat protein 13-like isoform X2 n=1 Tax=Orbicella faveolata TaxID=48498 RepID=UPI0009E3477A|nr:tetratricopeptide repeat protein 13-like isoform X2 [Orbicella faveolata]